ncbi:YciI family protein [uncultured Psychroserpens sp.]|uniref:YciI family protein n=1 Tax=uncultured Psychroserpens sp. TaxID=255436 RepID=UPI002629ED1A|nr:YciI family protein [uncultured Psychroserpens sp.]
METNLFINYLTLTDKYKDPDNWTQEVKQVIEAHGEFLNSLGNKGTLIFAGRTVLNPEDENLFGITVIKATTIDEAKQLFKNDPAIKANVQQSVVLPFSLGIQFFTNLKQ